MKAKMIFFNDDANTIVLSQPNGNGTRYTLFDSVSQAVNYCKANGIEPTPETK